MLDANYFLTLIYHIDILTPVVNLLPKGVLIMRRILEDVEKKLARLEREAEALDRQLGLTDANRYRHTRREVGQAAADQLSIDREVRSLGEEY